MTVEHRTRPVKETNPEPVSPEVNTVGKLSIVVIRTLDEIRSLDPSTEAVHLSRQEVVNCATISTLRAQCPGLKTIQTVPAFRRIIRGTFRKLMDEAGLELQIMRIHRKDLVPQWFTKDKRYLAKREFFKAAIEGEKGNDYREMVELKLPDALYAEAYFGPTPKCLNDLAEEFDVPCAYVQFGVATVMHWLGVESTSRNVQIRARNLRRRANRLRDKVNSLPQT